MPGGIEVELPSGVRLRFVFPTTGHVNLFLTITAIAMRTAERIGALVARGELSRATARPVRGAMLIRSGLVSISALVVAKLHEPASQDAGLGYERGAAITSNGEFRS